MCQGPRKLAGLRQRPLCWVAPIVGNEQLVDGPGPCSGLVPRLGDLRGRNRLRSECAKHPIFASSRLVHFPFAVELPLAAVGTLRARRFR